MRVRVIGQTWPDASAAHIIAGLTAAEIVLIAAWHRRPGLHQRED